MQRQIHIIHKDDVAWIFPLTTRLIPKGPAVFMIFSRMESIGPNGLEKVRLRANVGCCKNVICSEPSLQDFAGFLYFLWLLQPKVLDFPAAFFFCRKMIAPSTSQRKIYVNFEKLRTQICLHTTAIYRLSFLCILKQLVIIFIHLYLHYICPQIRLRNKQVY